LVLPGNVLVNKGIIFKSVNFLQGENLISMIGQRGAQAIFLLGGVAFWRSWTFGAVLVVLVLLLQGMDQSIGSFL
jgi:hypothetical protein